MSKEKIKLSMDGLIFQATKIEISNHILTITLNRPEKKNALNNVMINEINYALAVSFLASFALLKGISSKAWSALAAKIKSAPARPSMAWVQISSSTRPHVK